MAEYVAAYPNIELPATLTKAIVMTMYVVVVILLRICLALRHLYVDTPRKTNNNELFISAKNTANPDWASGISIAWLA
ncbi:hypothetical protein KUL49_35710 [Alteromonas sp. KUL49]|nr:hypothetical protein KUL49_35710 [Alteromonas sp. KUL49]